MRKNGSIRVLSQVLGAPCVRGVGVLALAGKQESHVVELSSCGVVEFGSSAWFLVCAMFVATLAA